MTMQTRLVSLLLSLLVAGTSQAEDAAGPRTLQDYLALARAVNPAILAANSQAGAAGEQVGVARGYPDPKLLYGYFLTPSMKEGRQELVLMQDLPFWGKRGLRGDVASAAARATAHMADATALDVDTAVKIAFYDYVRLHETERVLNEESQLLGRMQDAIQVRYAAERAEQQDVLKVTLAISQLDDQLTLNRRDLAAARARLNELIGRDADAPVADPQWEVPAADSLIAAASADSALAWRPEMAVARAEIEMARRSGDLARREYYPDFSVGAMYEFGGTEPDMWEVMAGISLPIWFGKRGAAVRAADAMKSSAEHRLRSQELRVRRELQQAMDRVRAAQERRRRFETVILPQAQQTFESSEAGYRAQRVDFLDYLDSERVLLSIRREYYEVIADLGMQVAELERALAMDAAPAK